MPAQTYEAISDKKFLDAAGVTLLARKMNQYPSNELLAAVIDGVQDALDEKGNAKTFYGTCTTAASTVTKAVVCSSFSAADLVAGAIIFVHFANTNSGAVGSLKLNVNDTGACNIKRLSAGSPVNLASKSDIHADETVLFVFDGTYWIAMNVGSFKVSEIVDFPTLGAAAAKGVTDNTTTTAASSTDENLVTGRTLYYALQALGMEEATDADIDALFT